MDLSLDSHPRLEVVFSSALSLALVTALFSIPVMARWTFLCLLDFLEFGRPLTMAVSMDDTTTGSSPENGD